MKKFRFSLLLISLFAGLALLSACNQSPPPAAAPKAAAPAPAPVPPAPAAPTPAPADQPAATPAAPADHSAAAAPTAALPAECEGYIAQVNECVNKQGNNPAAADALKKQMDQLRASWAQIPDKDALSKACKQASDVFAQHTKQMGC
ncbi:MAG: DUF5339 domain-containing protein [Betaproteobacteria bacterium]|nr:DUF5339 domain-containing protein [Betaproteobacteria bacterium]